jgi:nucleoside-diphosphate-sugar epimerase
MSRYVVTGCAGFIGSHLTEAILDRGDDVVGLDAFTDYYPRESKEASLRHARSAPGFSLVEGDLAEADLGDLIAGSDGVFHFAAQPAEDCPRATLLPRSATCAAPPPTSDAPGASSAGHPIRRSSRGSHIS